jgi:predicted nuclease of predicted toxin-antitoxin system
VKLWIDECLSPTLVARAHRRGYWATCNRDRDLLGVADDILHGLVIDEEAVFVTNDEADFVALYRQVDLHTGLLILPQAGTREELWPLLDAALDYIERQAKTGRRQPPSGCSTGESMSASLEKPPTTACPALKKSAVFTRLDLR